MTGIQNKLTAARWLVLLFLALGSLGDQALGFEKSVKAEARVIETCEYFTTWTGEFVVTYMNNSLRWGTTLDLVYGFHGWTSDTNGQTRDWILTKNSRLTAIAPYTWSTSVSEPVAVRSQRWFNQFSFVIKVTNPDRSIYYEKPNTTSFGYFNTNFLDEAGHGCSADEAQFKPLTLISVELQ